MTNYRGYLQNLKSMLSQEELEQLHDDPASFENMPDEEGVFAASPESPRLGAGPMGLMTGTGTAETGGTTGPARLTEVLRKFDDEEELTFEDAELAEAIILPLKRPAPLVKRDDYSVKHQMWLHLNEEGSARSGILSAIPSVGRINIPSNSAVPYAGTGFIVGENLLMTNRHVAELFANGLGENNVALKPGASVNIDFKAEHGSFKKRRLHVEGVHMIHPYWDMALLEVEGHPKGAGVLELSQASPQSLTGNEIAVIGYPAFDSRNDREVQNQLFNRIYNVKRLQPGFYKNHARVRSFDHVVRAACHDASTLGGNSGSVVVDLETGLVVGLHFGGLFKKSNFAVPTSELARDPYVARSGVNFAGAQPQPHASPWTEHWNKTQQTETPATDGGDALASPTLSPASGGGGRNNLARFQVTSHSGDGPHAELSINVPLKLTVGFDLPGGRPSPGPIAQSSVEKMVEPLHDRDYATRTGYDPNFLGLPLPMPRATNDDDLSRQQNGDTELKYHNFSIIMNAQRRLAQITACNIDASDEAKEPEEDFLYTRKSLNGFTSKNDREKWLLDPRIPAGDQLSDRFYNSDRTAFDKGHLVRRVAVAFGDSFTSVQLANGDTFHSTNCSPQTKGFNRSNLGGLWGKLENDVLSSAETTRCVVFSGPVFDHTDRVFHGRDLGGDTVVKIPGRYWKMVVTRHGEALRSFAYLLEQDLGDVAFEFAGAGDWAEHEIDPVELERLLGTVTFPHLTGDGEAKMTADEWTKLVQDPQITDEQIMEVSIIHQGSGAFDFRIAPNPDFVDLPKGAAETENAMAVANDLSRTRRKAQFNWRTSFGSKDPVLVSEMDSWGQFPVLIREIVDHLNEDYRVWSVGAAGDTAENMVLGPKEHGATEYMLALNDQREHVKGFVFSAAGNDIIGEDPKAGKPVLTDLLLPFNGDPTDINGHINHALLAEKLDFLRGVYKKVIGEIRADADFKKLPIFIHGYDYPFPYPWVNDNRRPVHAARDKWLGRPFTKRGIMDRTLRRAILTVFIDDLYDMLGEFSKKPKTTRVWLVDCRNTMPKVSDWIDEIHGTSAGFAKITKRFQECLNDAGV